MTGFFVTWDLWVQMTFVLFGALITVFALGFVRNYYAWSKNRKYVKLYGPGGIQPLQVDIEARAMVEVDEIPFGIRALQRGIEVEGVWISHNNTPVPGSPATSVFPSPPPSFTGGTSDIVSPSGRLPPPEFPFPDPAIPRLSLGKSRVPSFTLESLASIFGNGSLQQLYEYQQADSHSGVVYSSTLDALEGRVGQPSKISPEESTQENRKSRSELSSPFGEGSSNRDGSPSPPALTDGSSRANTPPSSTTTTSYGRRPSYSLYLSESNHRLSHVAETGQLTPRVRMPKRADTVVIPAIDPLAYRSTFNFSRRGPPRVHMPTRKTLNTSLPTSPEVPSFSDADIPILHAPRPVLSVRQPNFDLHSFHSEISPSDRGSVPHIRTASGQILTGGHYPSPTLAEYMFQSVKDDTSPVLQDMKARHTLSNDDVISLAPTTVSAPEQTAYRYSEYRTVNPNFEVRRRGTMGVIPIPLELPTLPFDKEMAIEVNSPVEEKVKSRRKTLRKIQKKKIRSKSLGG